MNILPERRMRNWKILASPHLRLIIAFIILIMISIWPLTAKADTSPNTAMANCRAEAVSTGLENETDITEYIDLCMQAWQSPSEYPEWNSATEEANESLTDTQESLDQ